MEKKQARRTAFMGIGLAVALAIGGGLTANAVAGAASSSGPAASAAHDGGGVGLAIGVGVSDGAGAEPVATVSDGLPPGAVIVLPDGTAVPSVDSPSPILQITESQVSTGGWIELQPDGTSVGLDGPPPVEGEMLTHFGEIAAALADAGLVPADTTAEQTAQWFLDGFDGAPFDITDPAVGEILSQVGVAVAHG